MKGCECKVLFEWCVRWCRCSARHRGLVCRPRGAGILQRTLPPGSSTAARGPATPVGAHSEQLLTSSQDLELCLVLLGLYLSEGDALCVQLPLSLKLPLPDTCTKHGQFQRGLSYLVVGLAAG